MEVLLSGWTKVSVSLGNSVRLAFCHGPHAGKISKASFDSKTSSVFQACWWVKQERCGGSQAQNSCRNASKR